MKDLRVELRFKNAILFNALEERFRLGMRSNYGVTARASRILGVSYVALLGYLNVSCTPWREDYNAHPVALHIAFTLGIDPEELFPRNLYEREFPKSAAIEMPSEHFLPLGAAQRFLPLDTTLMDKDIDLPQHVAEVLKRLSPREEKVIRARFGFDEPEKSFRDLGKDMALTPQRVCQIASKAIRKLRSLPNSSLLRPHIENYAPAGRM